MRGEYLEKYKEYGIENTTELRLLPYLQYCSLNNTNPSNTNYEEKKIMRKWEDKGWIVLTGSTVAISKEFWDIISEILWDSYAAKVGDDNESIS